MAWHPLTKAWHDTTVDYCDVCGNLLISRYWSFADADGRELRACREDDAWLWERLQVFRARAASARIRAADTAAESRKGLS